MTVSDAIDYLRRLHNEQNAQTPFWSDQELFALLEAKSNEVLTTIGLIEGRDQSIVTTAGTSDYNYPTNFIRIRRVRVNGIGIKYLNFRQFEARRPQGVQPSGTPREYTLWNDTIILTPTPSTSGLAFDIFGEKMQSSITSTSSTLDIPAVFHPALCDGVLSEMFMKDLNETAAQFYQNKWLQFHVPNMKVFAERRRRRGSSTVVIDPDSVIETEFGVI